MKKYKLISILIIAVLGWQNAVFTHGDDFKCLRPRAMEERDSDKVAKDFEIAKKEVKLLTLMNAQGIKSMLELSRRSGIDRAVIKDIIKGAVTPDENVITCLANVLKVKLNELRVGLGLWKPEPANIPPHLSEDKGPSPDRIFAVGIDKDILLALIGLLEIQPDIYFDQRLPAQRLYQAIRSKIGISPDKCSDIELGARLQRMLGEAISFKIFTAPNRDISYVVIDAGRFMKVAVKKLHPQGAIPQSAALQDAARRELRSFILRPVAAGEKKDNKEAVKEYERLEKFIATHGFEYGSLSDGSVHLHSPYPLICTIFNELKIVRGDLHKLHYLAVGAGDLSDSLVAASEEYSMKVTAVEKEPIVHQKARAILKEAKKRGLTSDDNLILLPSQDVFNMSWQGIDIAYFFYTEPADQADVKAMREKIHLRVREMNSNGILAVLFIGAQLFHNRQEVPGLIKIEPGPLWISDAMTGLYLYLYRASPSNIAPQGVIPQGVFPQDAAVKRLHSSILRPVAAGERFEEGETGENDQDLEKAERLIASAIIAISPSKIYHDETRELSENVLRGWVELVLSWFKLSSELQEQYHGNLLNFAEALSDSTSPVFNNLITALNSSTVASLFRNPELFVRMKEAANARIEKALRANPQNFQLTFRCLLIGPSRGHELASAATVIFEAAEEGLQGIVPHWQERIRVRFVKGIDGESILRYGFAMTHCKSHKTLNANLDSNDMIL